MRPQKGSYSQSRRIGKVHTTVHIRRAVLQSLNKYMSDLHLRRDMLLNNALRTALPELRRIQNAPRGAARANSILRRNNTEMVRLGLVLDGDIASNLTNICKQKNVSRDAFIERSIELLVGEGPAEGSPLGAANEILADPIGWVINTWGADGLYDNLSIDFSNLIQGKTRRTNKKK